MQELVGRVAVVTGAASGIGRAMAERFVGEGMRVVLADIEAEALDAFASSLSASAGDVLAVVTDVSDRGSVDKLAAATFEHFGPPNVLCNNAGVSGELADSIWSTTLNDWSWVVGVNLMGVVHGIQAFLPAMISSGDEGHVVNTSSVLGLATGGGSIYGVTKHAVTRLSEGLWYDLRAVGSRIGVSVLCPGLVATRIVSSARNRPPHLSDPRSPEAEAEVTLRTELVEQHFLDQGTAPAEIASRVLEAIRQESFYVITHPAMTLPLVRDRMSAILAEGDPPPALSLLELLTIDREEPNDG